MTPVQPPLVSVVTPVFNGGAYLEECIASVLEQTHRAWEYVIVDNCSTDNSLAIAEKYAARDARIRAVRSAEFVAQVPNFNRSLRMISPHSRYCKILQADDWMFPRCLEEMVAVAELDPRVGVVGSFSMYHDRVHHHGLPFSRRPVFPGPWTVRQYIVHDHYFIGSASCVMFRSDLVRARDPFYSEDTPAEDVETCLDLLAECDFGFVFQLLTFNRRGNEGYWTGVEDLAPDMLNDYLLVHRLGPRFLEPGELTARQAEMDKRYYSMLGRALVERRGAHFWTFHRKWLAKNNLSLNTARARVYALRHIIGCVLDPKTTLQRWWRRRSG